MFKYLKKFKINVIALFLAVFVFIFNFGASVGCSAATSNWLSAKNGAILVDSLTGDVLFEQNADKLAPVASTTKIMTVLVVLDYYKRYSKDLDEQFVVDSRAIEVEGTSMGLKKGDKVTMRDLCYGMLLASGNDAANAAAVKVAGSVKAFVKLMNKKAKDLGLKNTFFMTPSGLDEIEGVPKKSRTRLTEADISKMPHSTAREMAILTREAMKDTVFKKICASKTAKLCFGNPPYERTLYNSNKLLRFLKDVCCGVKTGFTDNAGRCLVSAARKGGVELIAVVLDDVDDWNDSKKLFNYGFSQFEEFKLPRNFSRVKPIVLGEKEVEISVDVRKPVRIFLTDSMKKRINTKIKAGSLLFAPIEGGEKIGEVEYYLDDKFVCKEDLVSKNRVKAAEHSDNDEKKKRE